MNDPSRRNFLRGKLSRHATEPRPPWAVDEPLFLERCTQCGDCARVCPTKIIRRGDGGYPTVDFSLGECRFCTNCVSACKSRALECELNIGPSETMRAPWALQASIGPACLAVHQVECRICGEQCEAQAIHFQPIIGGIAAPILDAERCTGCGACYVPCPVQAISIR